MKKDKSRQIAAMNQYFERNGIRNKDICDKLGLRASVVSNLLAGRDSLGPDRCMQLSKAYGFNIDFLRTGDGDLFGGPAPAPTYSQHAGVNNGTMQQNNGCPDISELMDKIDKLTADLKAKEDENTWLRNLVDRLAPEGK